MFRSFPRTSVAILLVMSLSFMACADIKLEDDVLTAPSGTGFVQPTVNTLVIPATTLPFQIMPVQGCPSSFVAHFSLVVRPINADLTMTEVGMQFVDTSGFLSPVNFAENDLRVLFGSTTVIAGAERAFPFNTTFGCSFQASPHIMRGRALFINSLGGTVERTFEGRFGTR